MTTQEEASSKGSSWEEVEQSRRSAQVLPLQRVVAVRRDARREWRAVLRSEFVFSCLLPDATTNVSLRRMRRSGWWDPLPLRNAPCEPFSSAPWKRSPELNATAEERERECQLRRRRHKRRRVFQLTGTRSSSSTGGGSGTSGGGGGGRELETLRSTVCTVRPGLKE